ncbi:BTB/POZ/MATH-domain protein [Rhynchospora pubera]|uniref:BTB/POZ/MATH-domain protein n=1 Tax=Rhynchospora pubera TaxID=906938 RepID=A0AAV8HNV0_9POAL|nr:BTB/POZ/MATH-domain protein [Rhynchospora pubera]
MQATWLGSPLLRIRNMVSSVVDAVESEIASTRLTEISTGSHLFKFIGYSSNKGIGVGKCITSDVFTLGGYEWTITYYPDGNSSENKNFLAFYVTLRSDGTNARVKISLTMPSQTEGTPVMGYSSDAVTLSTNESWGFLIKREEFEASEHLRDNSFTIKCTVTVIKNSRFTVLPSNLHQQLTSLLEHGDGTDVSFNVSGVTFDAHRCVLAARSPVFMAQFFGPMKGESEYRNQGHGTIYFQVHATFHIF